MEGANGAAPAAEAISTENDAEQASAPRSHRLQRRLVATTKRLWHSQLLSWRRLKQGKHLPRVPWGSETVVQVMFLWVLAFCFLGRIVLPLAVDLAGYDYLDLTPRLQALSHLLLDVLQLAATMGILRLCLRMHRSRVGGLDRWFPVSLQPLAAWVVPTVAACALFPGIAALSAVSEAIFPATWGSSIQESLGTGDLVTNAMYFAIVGLCAPVWEETMFRGFLLPSFGRWMPMPAAVATSGAIFALAHLQTHQFMPLLALGTLLGLLFVHTRNLLAPMLLHSAWNLYTFSSIIRTVAGTPV